MPGERKTKAVAKRIDPSYARQPSPMRTLRRVLVLVCGLGAVAWGGWAIFAKSERMYNPGPVAAAHAMFENNCAACHDGGGHSGGGGGGFLKGVSDAACLACHDGAIHSEKQVSLASMSGGRPVTSSNCVACHVEHRGHEALAGTSDLLCTRCHDNLTANVAGGQTAMQANVKAFDAPPAHPSFGRVLKQPVGGGQWADLTPLKFNHKKHLGEINPPAGECATCHRPSTSGDHHIMQPVSYEANCKSCHPMSLAPNLPDVPHQPMEIVRLFTATVPSSFAQRLAAMTPEEKEKALTVTTERRVGLRKVTETKKVTEAEWIDAQTKELIDKKVAGSPAANRPEYKAIEGLEPAARNAAALELYAAYGMGTSCGYCHTLAGAPAAIAKSPAETLHTLPTGYAVAAKGTPTTGPSAAGGAAPSTRPVATPEGRRWFAASVFDHDAHRFKTCNDCHAQAQGSTVTSDVLLPDAQTCVACHHPGGRGAMSASNNCVTCHVYHDRERETGRGRDVAQVLGTPSR